MAEAYEIKFWAHQFYEHFSMIQDIFIRNDLLDEEIAQQLKELQDQWVHVQHNPDSGDLEDLIEMTREAKDQIEQLVREQELPCIPDLLLHMKDELDYFDRAIVHQEWSFAEEMKWWAEEHSSALEFDNCQLPQLISEDSLVAKVVGHPEEVDQLAVENANLSSQFRALLEEEDETILYQQLMLLKAQHLDGLTKAIYSVENLPLSPETQKLVYVNLKHSSAEAEFAFKRLEKLSSEFLTNQH